MIMPMIDPGLQIVVVNIWLYWVLSGRNWSGNTDKGGGRKGGGGEGEGGGRKGGRGGGVNLINSTILGMQELLAGIK